MVTAEPKVRGSANNPLPNQLVTFDGQTRTLSQWATLMNRTPGGLHRHIRRVGFEVALTQPNRTAAVLGKSSSRNSPWRTKPSVTTAPTVESILTSATQVHAGLRR